MNEEHKSMSPLTALILGLSGIIIAAIIVGGVVANKGLEKIDDPEAFVENLENQYEGIGGNGPSIDEAKDFVNTNWSDLASGIPNCEDGAEVCPSIMVGVSAKYNDRTGRMFNYITAEVVGFGDDSYAGYGREASVKRVGDSWVYTSEGSYAYTSFKLCRNMQRYPEGASCP